MFPLYSICSDICKDLNLQLRCNEGINIIVNTECILIVDGYIVSIIYGFCCDIMLWCGDSIFLLFTFLVCGSVNSTVYYIMFDVYSVIIYQEYIL